MKDPIYLDGFSTMPLAPEAQEIMLEVWRQPSNAGSPHRLGERAAAFVADGRAAVAALIGASPSEVYFTSGATEANNLAILGLARWATDGGSARRRIIVSSVEHKAVSEPAEALRAQGFDIAYAPVDGNGVVDLAGLAELANDETLLISVMAANNETGVLQPIDEVVKIGRRSGTLVHCDAAQAAGKIPISVTELDIDYLSLSAHKLYGPCGVGALYIAAAAPRPKAQVFGGGQQNALRPGTEPTALIAGFGAAAQVAMDRMEADAAHGRDLSDKFRQMLSEAGLQPEITTGNRSVLPGALSIYLRNVDADELVLSVSSRVSLSTGSACSSGQVVTSHVLASMGFSQEKSKEIFRVLFNRHNTVDDVLDAAAVVAKAVGRLKDRTGRSHQW
ncbi:cysteine desulfurase [Rhizobium leguminosarum]|uniref:cysteine desulfurase family protein n=1 Tax=Rhizobium leguminosarum TaxID=384 RepID=UPI0014410E1E|nr:cysteine desulfurase family protein [Rhizobium leguminosarum]MBY5841275.1 cysteine desulfurase [Rhizobium leguminosarum]NKM80966.1 aminotransferase class V-fold PLP-dependent enzyme [Rhizobium leguminosarum bv. viciae]QSZ07259.1 cysteine desulfurase [Rhizobium leguminosarum]